MVRMNFPKAYRALRRASKVVRNTLKLVNHEKTLLVADEQRAVLKNKEQGEPCSIAHLLLFASMQGNNAADDESRISCRACSES